MSPTYRNLVLHIPHSSTYVPECFCSDTPQLTREAILALARPYIDYYTDQLFAPTEPSTRIRPMVCEWCRVVSDGERLEDDPLEEKGCGIMMLDAAAYGDRAAEVQALSRQLYDRHQVRLRQLLVDSGERTLLIDCHSFSSSPTPLCPHPGDTDICLGFNDDWSRPSDEVIMHVSRYFRERGYRVGLNTPFSNAKTVADRTGYHSLMIEVSKRLYMDEQTLQPTEGFARLQSDIQGLYPLLLE